MALGRVSASLESVRFARPTQPHLAAGNATFSSARDSLDRYRHWASWALGGAVARLGQGAKRCPRLRVDLQVSIVQQARGARCWSADRGGNCWSLLDLLSVTAVIRLARVTPEDDFAAIARALRDVDAPYRFAC